VRILFAGATGVLGRATLPHLSGHELVGLTRSAEKRQLLTELGAETAVCDVYDYEALFAVVERVRPHAIVNFVTDLAGGSSAANTRVRNEGGANLLRAADLAGASRLIVESVAFELEGDAAQAVAELERSARTFSGETVILRFGRLWGPGTAYGAPPRPPSIHVAEAGARAALLIPRAAPGVYEVRSC
jgi:dTDP-4-dehydrorhamnose reductase